MNKKLRLTIVAISIGLIMIIVAVWILKDGVTVVIRNVGDDSMKSVIVHVTGNSYPIGDIDAGATKTVKVVTTGESDIVIEHGNQGKLVVGAYFESSYRGKISIVVTSDHVVNVKNETRIRPF